MAAVRWLRSQGEPMLLQPGPLGLQGLAAPPEGTKHRPTDRREVDMPVALAVGLDVTGAADLGAAQRTEIDRLVINGLDRAVPIDDEPHHASPGAAAWR